VGSRSARVRFGCGAVPNRFTSFASTRSASRLAYARESSVLYHQSAIVEDASTYMHRRFRARIDSDRQPFSAPPRFFPSLRARGPKSLQGPVSVGVDALGVIELAHELAPERVLHYVFVSPVGQRRRGSPPDLSTKLKFRARPKTSAGAPIRVARQNIMRIGARAGYEDASFRRGGSAPGLQFPVGVGRWGRPRERGNVRIPIRWKRIPRNSERSSGERE
jgi:hypothetical protein